MVRLDELADEELYALTGGLRETAAMIRRNETQVRLPSPNNARKPGPIQLTHLRVRRRAQERITGNFGKHYADVWSDSDIHRGPERRSRPFIRETLDGTSFALSVVGDREGRHSDLRGGAHGST
jgi:hypothetical protein